MMQEASETTFSASLLGYFARMKRQLGRCRKLKDVSEDRKEKVKQKNCESIDLLR